MQKRNLQIERERRGLSRNKVAKVLGIKPQSLETLENGKTDPSYGTLQKIEEFFAPLKHSYLFATEPDTEDCNNTKTERKNKRELR